MDPSNPSEMSKRKADSEIDNFRANKLPRQSHRIHKRTAEGKPACEYKGCTKQRRKNGLCKAHGGADLCNTPDCSKPVHLAGKCSAHSPGRCIVAKCYKRSISDNFCIDHVNNHESLAFKKRISKQMCNEYIADVKPIGMLPVTILNDQSLVVI